MRHDPAGAAIVIMLRSLKMYGMAQAVGELMEQGERRYLMVANKVISAFETETVAGEVGEMFGNPMVALFEALGDSIAAGSNEVLRNVVAGALLKKKLPQTRDGWVRN